MADVLEPGPIPAIFHSSLRALLRGEGARWPAGARADDAARFLESIEEHGIAPLLYSLLPDASWPIHAALRDAAIHAAAVESIRLAGLRSLFEALAATDVSAIIIKGTALAYDLYESPELRPRGDTDLLIAEADLAAVRNLMLDLGYKTSLTSGDTLAIRQQTFIRDGHVYDIHWDVTNSAVVRDALPFSEIAARAVNVSRIASNALAPCRADALLIACIHRVAHHHDNERLIWLYDIHLLREAMSAEEHAGFWRLAADRRVATICEHSIELADAWFGDAAHNRAAVWLPHDVRGEPSAAYLDHDRRRGALLRGELQALDLRSRLRRLRELAFPPVPFMRQSFPSAPSVALPLLYAWRGARGMLRLLGRVRGD